MAHTPLFFDRRLRIQPLPIHETFACIRIHGEIADLKGSKVLEEMAALGRGYAKIAEAGFHDDTRPGNFVPLDWNAQPRII